MRKKNKNSYPQKRRQRRYVKYKISAERQFKPWYYKRKRRHNYWNLFRGNLQCRGLKQHGIHYTNSRWDTDTLNCKWKSYKYAKQLIKKMKKKLINKLLKDDSTDSEELPSLPSGA